MMSGAFPYVFAYTCECGLSCLFEGRPRRVDFTCWGSRVLTTMLSRSGYAEEKMHG